MQTINIRQAKTQLSRLIERVNAGEEIVIARAGRRVARLVPATASAAPRKPGLMKGRIRVSKDFDAPLPKEHFGTLLVTVSASRAGFRVATVSKRLPRSAATKNASTAPTSSCGVTTRSLRSWPPP